VTKQVKFEVFSSNYFESWANDKAIAIADAMELKIDSVFYISEGEMVFPGPFMSPAGLGK
jgi:hypothetical protein